MHADVFAAVARAPVLKKALPRSATRTQSAPPAARPVHARQATAPEEITVTSQRRSQPLQRVPVTVEVFSGRDLARRGVTTIGDVTRLVSNTQNFDIYGGGMPTWVIRGVSLQDFNPNNTPTAPIFIDDVYQPSNVMGGQSLFDVARVEVLKGPQSGLYGRNTLGGAVRVVTEHPNAKKQEGNILLSYGRWGDFLESAAYNQPLSEKWAIRIAQTSDHGTSGWQRSLDNGQRWGAKNKDAVRLEIAGDLAGWNVLFNVHASRDRSQLPLGRAISVYAPGDGFAFCPSLLLGEGAGNCQTLAQKLGYSNQAASRQSTDGSTTLSSPINRLNNLAIGGMLQLNHKIGDLTLTSQTSYDYFRYGLDWDYDATSPVLGQYAERMPMTNVQQSLRLASQQADRLSWIAGLDFAYGHMNENRLFYADQNGYLAGLVGIPTKLDNSQLRYNQNSIYGSAYVQAHFRLSRTVSFDGAVRGLWDNKTYRNGSFSNPTDFPISKNLSSNYQLDDHLTGKISASWQMNPNALLYASVVHGNKSGGFYGGFPLSVAFVNPYREETAWSYELGFKTSTRDRRLIVNGALFYENLDDIQGFNQIKSSYSHTIYRILTNIGDGVNRGAELGVTYKPVRGMIIHLNGGYLDAHITSSSAQFLDVTGIAHSLVGSQIDFAPRWSFTPDIRYEIPFRNGDQVLGMQLGYSYRSNLTAPRGVIENQIYKIKGYGLLDARIDYTFHRTGLTLGAGAYNMSNQHYRTYANTDGTGSYYELYGQPASYRFDISYHF